MLELVPEEYGVGAADGFRATLAVVQLASDREVQVSVSTLREWMPWPRDTRLSGNVAPDRKRYDSHSKPPAERSVCRLVGAIDPRLV